MLEVKNVIKNYHGKRVVDGLSFSVDKGQILGMIGANGAGKSTCVSMIATLIKPDGGTILYNGEDIVSNPRAIRSPMVSALRRSAMPLAIALLVVLLLSALLTTPALLMVRVD